MVSSHVLLVIAWAVVAAAHPSVQPKGYRIELQPDLIEGTYRGRVKIDIVNRGAEPIEELQLHVDPLLKVTSKEIKLIKLANDDLSDEESEEDLPITVSNVEQKDNILTLACSQNLQQDSTYQLDVQFEAHISNDYNRAFFRDSFVDLTSGETRWFAVLSPRNHNAHQVFPCFDQPALKSWFELTVVHKNAYTALANTPVMEQSNLTETGEIKVTFSRTPQMSINSLGLLISSFKMPQTDYVQTDGVKIGVWGREELGPALSKAQSLLPSVLVSLELYLSRPYPLQHLNLVALPTYFGDKPIDSWGLQFFKESDLMDTNSYWLTNKVAKASAMQWVAHLATPLNDTLVTNSLSTFLANLVAKQLEPAHYSWTLNSFHTLVLELGKARNFALDEEQINYLKETKISLLMKMFEEVFGATTFKQALQNFLAKKEFKTYREMDVWQILTEQAWVDNKLPTSLTLGQVASQWLKKRVPLITVTVDYKKNRTTFTQEEFIDSLESSMSKVVKKGGVEKNAGWWIPLRIKEGNNEPRTLAWLPPDQHSLTFSNISLASYLIVNPATTGPYLVNYDGESWRRLTDEFKKQPADVRAQLLHDSLSLALAGHLQSVTALQVVNQLKQEQSPEVWRSFFPLAERLRKMFQGTLVAEKLDELIKALLIPVNSALGEEDKQAWKSELRTKTQFLLCETGHTSCVETARTQFAAWMNQSNPDEGMPMGTSYLCPILSYGSYAEWEFAFDRLINLPKNRTRMERNFILKAVAGCPKDSKKLQTLINTTFLEESQSQTFTNEDRFLILSALSGETAGYTTLFEQLKTRWEEFKSKLQGNLWEFFIQTATGSFRTEEGLKEVKELCEEKKEDLGPRGIKICEESIQRVEARVKWTKDNTNSVETWLNQTMANPWTHQRFKFQDVIVSP